MSPPVRDYVQRSPAMREVFSLALRVAEPPSTSALIVGESGAGKEVVSNFIHARSARAACPFIRVNVAALGQHMIEAELFGAVRGAYTGSVASRKGFFVTADHGTLLLDEFCELPVEMQPKLLRVLEERRFYPVGSDRERSVDVRVLAATNRDPEEAQARGALRRDLFFRMSTVIIRVPSLRERREDIRPLSEHFASIVSCSFGRNYPLFSSGAVRLLEEYDWPGNVRELRNVVERAILLSESSQLEASDVARALARTTHDRQVGVADPLAPSVARALELASEKPLDLNLAEALKVATEEVEQRYIQLALAAAEGSPTQAARLLGVSRTTLWTKLKRYGLTDSALHGKLTAPQTPETERKRKPS